MSENENLPSGFDNAQSSGYTDSQYQQAPQQQFQQTQQQQYQQAPQQPYNGLPQQPGLQYAQDLSYGSQPMNYGAQPAPFENNSTTYIVLSVLEFLFCGGLFAIIPFVFSLQYRDAYLQGNYELAASKKKNAKTALIVILVVGIVLTILAFVAMTTFAASYYAYTR